MRVDTRSSQAQHYRRRCVTCRKPTRTEALSERRLCPSCEVPLRKAELLEEIRKSRSRTDEHDDILSSEPS